MQSIRSQRLARRWSQRYLAWLCKCSLRVILNHENANTGAGSWPGEMKKGGTQAPDKRGVAIRLRLIKVFKDHPPVTETES